MSAARLVGLALAVACLSSLYAPPALAQASAPGAVARGPASPDDRLKEAERDPKLHEQYVKNGKKVAAFCANCHGEGGNSVKGDVPNLAGQNPAYLLDQLRQFSDGRRKNVFMEGLMKALSADEKVAVAVFYAHQELQHRPAKDQNLAARGKSIYEKNCFRCHGELGHGTDRYARIAGQQNEYLDLTLRRYRDGSSSRADPLMAANTRNLSDADLQAVVAYVASMK